MKTKEIGKFKKAWLLTKASWKALLLDKELVALPIIGFLASVVSIVPFIVFIIFKHDLVVKVTGTLDSFQAQPTPLGYILLVLFIVVTTAISSLFGGAVVHGAIDRFNGNNPTIRSSFKAARAHAGSLIQFGIFATFVGIIISEVAQRIPYFGAKVVAWLAGSAWNIASFFAVPVIVSEKSPIGPIKATKKSVEIIKKVWGESLIVSVTIGLISFLITMAYVTGIVAIMGLGAALSANAWYFGIIGVLGFLGLIVIIFIFSVLEAFTKAAIYHYAVTGESPATFDNRLMRTAFTTKKARKLFSIS